MQESETPAAEPPQFLHELAAEIRSFFTTLRDFALHPVAAPRAWSEGRLQALNPVTFYAAAAGFEYAVTAIVRHYRPAVHPVKALFHFREELEWLLELVQQQIPFVTLLAFASLLHWWLRKKGATQAFRATLGVLLFVSGLESIVSGCFNAALGAVGSVPLA